MMKVQQFLELIIPQAKEAQRNTGIAASALIAQAALESSWGRSQLSQIANNLFGIKADASWSGLSIDMPTKEFINGAWVSVPAKWRAYANWKESIIDHAKFLLAPRYAPAMAVKYDPIAFCEQLQSCGYATDPHYADLLISIIKGRNMTQYDSQQPRN